MNEETDEVIVKMNQIKKTLGIHQDLVTPSKPETDTSDFIIAPDTNMGLEKELYELKRHLNDAKKEVNELRQLSVSKLPEKQSMNYSEVKDQSSFQ